MGSANHSARLIKKAIRMVTALAVALPSLTCLVTPEAKATDLGDGKEHYERGEFQEAILSFDRAIAQNSLNPKAFNSRGFTHFRLMKYRLAIADFDRAIALEPTFALAFINRGRANFSLKRYDLAMSDYNRAIELDPANARYFNFRGFLFFTIDQSDRAISDYTRAIALDPSFALALNNRGRAYAERNQYEKALPDLDRSIELDPSNGTAYANRSLVYARLKRPKESSRDLGIALKLDPNNDRVQEANALLTQGSDKLQTHNQLALTQHSDNSPLGTTSIWSQPSDNAPINSKSSWTQQNDNPPTAKRAVLPQQSDNAPISSKPAMTQQVDISQSKSQLALKPHINNSPIQDKWALVIGVSKFAHPAYNLHYAAKDAQDFYNYLIKDAHFQTDHVLLLLDDKATKVNILNAFGDKWLPNLCQEGDLAVVYVSTHGTPAAEDRGGQNYIVAYDTDADALFATGVDMDELYGQIKGRIKTDRALIIMDTCYSGGGVPGSKGIVRGANFNAKDLAQGCGHLVITSSSPNERSWESKSLPNGVFTTHLIDALRADGGNIDVKSAFEKTKRDVLWDVKSSYGESQTPQLGGEWEGSSLILSAPASAPRPMPPDAQFFVIVDTHPMTKSLPPRKGH